MEKLERYSDSCDDCSDGSGIPEPNGIFVLYAAARAREDAMLGALKDAVQTIEFERHPFRPWHEKARKVIRDIEEAR